MSKKENEVMDVAGLDSATTAQERKDAEYNLVESLLAAADFRNDDDLIKEIEIKRAGKFMFSFKIRPISDSEAAMCRKKATTYMRNPNNPKLPPIEKDRSTPKYHSWLIYTATVDEDKAKIWGNKAIKDKYNVVEDADSVDILLRAGEKSQIADVISEISGIDEQYLPVEDYVKN